MPLADSSAIHSPNRAYYPALDGLRAVSFFGVFLHHYMTFPYGWAGVDVFFVLSGFLITGILYDTRDDLHRVRNFYIRRTLRIFPLYYGVLLGIFLLTPLLHWAWTWQWIAWPLYLGNFLRFLYPHIDSRFVDTFADAQIASRIHPNLVLYLGHFWTLCVEEQFYIVWPWVVFTVRSRRKLMAICATFIVLVPIARYVALACMPDALVSGYVVYHATFFRFDTLLVGALIALLYRGAQREQLQRIAQAVLAVATLCAMIVVYQIFRFHTYTYPDSLPTWPLTVIALFAGALILRTLVPGSIPYRILNQRWLRAIGTVSYGAYVFHDIFHRPLQILVERYCDSPYDVILTAILAFVVTVLLSFLSYRFFERPILRMKERFAPTP